MKLVRGQYPPLFDEIKAVFPAADNVGVLFSWQDRIYWPKPNGADISAALYAHEAVHGRRQAEYVDGVEGWWRRYLVDKDFRFEEEILAHKAEYAEFCRNSVRNQRRMYLHSVASRLASALYGRMIPYQDARSLIKQGAA